MRPIIITSIHTIVGRVVDYLRRVPSFHLTGMLLLLQKPKMAAGEVQGEGVWPSHQLV